MSFISGGAPSLGDTLRARILDALNILAWQNTKDGHKNRNRPASVLEALLERTGGKKGGGKKDLMAFRSGATFSDFWGRNGGG